MSRFTSDRARAFYAQTYDASVGDWRGEIDFYRELAAKAHQDGQAVLELACGTGRVAMRLALGGVEVVGFDISSAMLEVAREKSTGLSNIRWARHDMRAFDLGETFGLVVIPGHSFQNLLTASDQLGCLQSIERHLSPHGTLVVHLDHQDIGRDHMDGKEETRSEGHLQSYDQSSRDHRSRSKNPHGQAPF